jgi:hypothetical protein
MNQLAPAIVAAERLSQPKNQSLKASSASRVRIVRLMVFLLFH